MNRIFKNMNTARYGLMLLVLAFAVPSTRAQQPANPNGSPTESGQSGRYRIGPGEVLDIRILKHPELSRENVRVDEGGMIHMPLIKDDIQAACKTENELAKEIAAGYLKYYRDPQVDVFVKEYHSREVAVIGAINDQGRYQMARRIRLLELLTYAKGPSDKAGQTVNIVRNPRPQGCEDNSAPAEETAGFISLRLNDTLRGEPKANPFIQPGDIVTVPEADEVYVVGNVYHPQALAMKDPISVSRAVAMAGGPVQDAKTDHVRIIRQQPGTNTKQEIIVNLGAIARKQADDVALLPNDIVEVPTSTGKSLIRSLLGAVAPAAAQLPVRVIP
jgi:polysaccharide export outer membrane protein